MNLTIEEFNKNKATIVALLHKTRRRGMDEVVRYLFESGFLLYLHPSIVIIIGGEVWHNIVWECILQLKNMARDYLRIA